MQNMHQYAIENQYADMNPLRIHHIFFSSFHWIFLEKMFSPVFTRIFSRKKLSRENSCQFFFSISHEFFRIL